METQLIQQARELAREIFSNSKFEKHPYHNFEHTREVAEAAGEIGERSSLSPEEMEAVLIAAWLHDIGYLDNPRDHEAAAADRARVMLENWQAPSKLINQVSDAILATRMPQQPKSLVSQVLCDADLHHLAAPNFIDRADLLRQEWTLEGKSMNDEEWLNNCIEFMKGHQYHTPYGRQVLQELKRKNIKKLRKQLPEKESESLQEEVERLRAKLAKERILKPDRGIETMFRVTSTNHLMLSGMADTKANIMISINSIILSVVVSVLIRKLEENPNLTIPTIMLVTVCLATIVFAILATRPTVTSGRFAREDIQKKRTNLLFFGNFHSMDIDNYEWAMKEMMKDGDYLYGSLIKDIYYLGKVLGRKYKFLRISYNIFMFGFVLSVLSFVIALFL
jgi:predicted metal-dependent HD superfamily phosphohydrolase